MAPKYTSSPAVKIVQSLQRGRAKIISGSSQSTYCGEYTLLVIKKAATTKKATEPRRGRRGPKMIKTAMPTQPRAKSPRLTRFTWTSSWPARESTYQKEPRSPPRSELNCQKLRHASGARMSTGRLTASQLITNVDSIDQKSAIRRERRQSFFSDPGTSEIYTLSLHHAFALTSATGV